LCLSGANHIGFRRQNFLALHRWRKGGSKGIRLQFLIAVVRLLPSHVANIEARDKAFYSVDRRVDDDQFDLMGDDGFWAVVGSPIALLDAERRAVGSLVYDTGIARRFSNGKWDYALIDLDAEENPDIPKDFEGMSGGGLWRAGYRMKKDRSRFWFDNVGRDIVLAGVTFWQTDSEGRQLIAHGPKSIYESLVPLVGNA